MKNIITRFKGFFLLMAGIVWGKLTADPDITTGTVATWYNATSDRWKGQNEAGVVKTFATEEGIASGVTFTQTYSTASATVAAVTSHAITDSTGGSVSTTALAAQTLPTDVTLGTLSGTADGAMQSVGATNSGDVSAAISNNFKELQVAQAANLAQLTAIRNAIATLAAESALNKADLLAMKQNDNKIIDALQAAGIAL